MLQEKLMIQTQEKNQKSHFGPDLGPLGFKNLTSLVTRYHGQLLSCTISEKTNDPILTKFSDRRTDRQTNRQTD